MKRNLTCIVCPLGCSLEAEIQEGKVVSVLGNSCPRGKDYAETECTHPTRTVTSTVRCVNGEMLSVKTSKPIPKEKMRECMDRINLYTATLPIKIGDVLISDVFGADIIATQNKNA